jgi:DNA-binding NarL/FixJ family response regulator
LIKTVERRATHHGNVSAAVRSSDADPWERRMIEYVPDADELRRDGPSAGLGNGRPANGCALEKPLRILIADNNEVVRIGLKSILEDHEGWEVIAEADNGKDAIAHASKARPDVAIIAFALPLINGVEVTRQIRTRLPATEVLIFAAHESGVLVNEALHAGARAILLKSDAKGVLLAAVASLAVRKPFFGGKLSEQLLQTFLSQSGNRDSELSPRERTVVQLIAEGNSNKQISNVLNLSIKTVETHRAAAMRKLDVGSTAGLVRYAVRNRLIDP